MLGVTPGWMNGTAVEPCVGGGTAAGVVAGVGVGRLLVTTVFPAHGYCLFLLQLQPQLRGYQGLGVWHCSAAITMRCATPAAAAAVDTAASSNFLCGRHAYTLAVVIWSMVLWGISSPHARRHTNQYKYLSMCSTIHPTHLHVNQPG